MEENIYKSEDYIHLFFMADIPVSSLPATRVFISYVPSRVYNASTSVNAFMMYLSCVIPFPPRAYLPSRQILLARSVAQALNIETIPAVSSPLSDIWEILSQTRAIAWRLAMISTSFICMIWKEEMGTPNCYLLETYSAVLR